jgi:hypothetical protein
VLIDAPTNLAIQKRLDQDKLKSLIQDIQSDLNQFNIVVKDMHSSMMKAE